MIRIVQQGQLTVRAMSKTRACCKGEWNDAFSAGRVAVPCTRANRQLTASCKCPPPRTAADSMSLASELTVGEAA